MKVYVLTGADEWALRARRAALLAELDIAAQNVERFDLDHDGGAELVRAASTFSLFGGARLLDAEPAEALLPEHATALLATGTDVTVILRSAAAPPAVLKKALADGATFERFAAPTGKGIGLRIGELAAIHGITLDPPVRAVIEERAGHDLPRVAGVMAQLAGIGLTRPTAAHLERMLGTSAAPGVPWALSDAIEAGDVAAALELAATLEPVAVVNYLASRTGQLGRIIDDGLADPDAIAGAFGMASRFPAQKLARLAARLGRRGVAESWDAVAAADRSVKIAPDPRAALDILVVRLAALWGAGTAPVPRETFATLGSR